MLTNIHTQEKHLQGNSIYLLIQKTWKLLYLREIKDDFQGYICSAHNVIKNVTKLLLARHPYFKRILSSTGMLERMPHLEIIMKHLFSIFL